LDSRKKKKKVRFERKKFCVLWLSGKILASDFLGVKERTEAAEKKDRQERRKKRGE